MTEFKHTSAAEAEEFLNKSAAEQALWIWMSARETNGEVARVKQELAAQGLEIQKARVQLSNHLDDHHDAELVLAGQRSTVDDIKKWGYRGTVFLAVLVTLFGGPTAVVHALHIFQAAK